MSVRSGDVSERKRLLWVGDAGAPTGFAKATHAILDTVRKAHDVTVLGINYRGDPHDYPYSMYVAAAGGDAMGIGRLVWMCDLMQPDVIVIQNDGWNIPFYMRQLAKVSEHRHIPVIAALAVDGKNFQGAWLKGVAHTVFWTRFAQDEARAGGYDGPSTVVPLGVDLETFHPMDKYEARLRRLPRSLDDAFIVGNVNRNQPRKRLDLTLKYFAEWVKARDVKDAYLYLHVAPTGETSADLGQLARYYGIPDRMAVMEPPEFYGLDESQMRETYNCMDVQVSTTQGEGFGLTTFEGMACGVPQIVPNWSALGELTKDAVWQVACSTTAIGPPYVNVIGGVPDQALFTQALDSLYRNPKYREHNSKAGLERVRERRFSWQHIGDQWVGVVDGVVELAERKAAEAEVPA